MSCSSPAVSSAPTAPSDSSRPKVFLAPVRNPPNPFSGMLGTNVGPTSGFEHAQTAFSIKTSKSLGFPRTRIWLAAELILAPCASAVAALQKARQEGLAEDIVGCFGVAIHIMCFLRVACVLILLGLLNTAMYVIMFISLIISMNVAGSTRVLLLVVIPLFFIDKCCQYLRCSVSCYVC